MWRTVIISSGEKITVKDNWLVVSNGEKTSRVPI